MTLKEKGKAILQKKEKRRNEESSCWEYLIRKLYNIQWYFSLAYQISYLYQNIICVIQKSPY